MKMVELECCHRALLIRRVFVFSHRIMAITSFAQTCKIVLSIRPEDLFLAILGLRHHKKKKKKPKASNQAKAKTVKK
jgi:hypothetical protein